MRFDRKVGELRYGFCSNNHFMILLLAVYFTDNVWGVH